ncbi:sn-1-specific diacylglycerol lipase ABHD11 [Haematobia irritans]|uniref:sn-1-specific diacylglycerol lipase ABHD11 n=1 Tax=Haematobia irritans TaxID=7368 RepID=UPI003F4F7A64
MLFCGRRAIYPLVRATAYVRGYSDVRPVKMAYNVFEGPSTDISRPPLIIMHGLFGLKQNWRAVGKALQAKTSRRIITVDARNHGDSPHTDEHSYIDMAADVVHLMQQMNIGKASVMGHSMGGRTMMYMALKYPELVESGVIVDISPLTLPRDFQAMEDIFVAMKTLRVPPELSMAEGRKYAEVEMKKAIPSNETVDFILLNLRKNPDGTFKWAANVQSLYTNLRLFSEFTNYIGGLPPYKGPMMFICGNKSNFVDPDSWPQIQEIFPNSNIHWLDAGHLVHFEQPAKFIDLLVNFLKQ